MKEYVTQMLARVPAELAALLVIGGSLLLDWLLKLGLACCGPTSGARARPRCRRTEAAPGAGSGFLRAGAAAVPTGARPLEVARRVVGIAFWSD